MPEHLLHFTQIGAAVEHMGRGTVPQGVRTDVRNARLASLAMYDLPDNPLVDPTAPATKEQRLPRAIACKRGAPGLQPLVQRTRRRRSERNDTLLISFAGDANGSLGEIDVGNVDADKFPNADARRIEQLHHCGVADGDCTVRRRAAGLAPLMFRPLPVAFRSTLSLLRSLLVSLSHRPCTPPRCVCIRIIHQGFRLCFGQYRRKHGRDFRGHEHGRGVAVNQPLILRPTEEATDCHSPACHAGTRVSAGAFTGHPRPQIVHIDPIERFEAIDMHGGKAVQHIDAIRFQRIVAGGAIDAKIMEKLVDNRLDLGADELLHL